MTKASEEIAAAKRYVLNQVAGLRVYDGIKARLDALEAALAGVEGGEWTDADRHAAYRAVADCHSDGERELDAYAFAALDAVAYRLAPSAREVPAGVEWTRADAEKLGGRYVAWSVRYGMGEQWAHHDAMLSALREVFPTRPTASEDDEFWQGIKRSAAQVEGLPAWSGAGVRDHHDKPAASGALTEHERRCFDRVFEAAGLSDDSAPAAMRDAARSAYERIAGVRPTASEAQEPAQPVGDGWGPDSWQPEEPAQPTYVNANPADALRPNDRHGMVEQPAGDDLSAYERRWQVSEQPAGAVDVLTAEEHAIVNRVDLEKYPYGRAVRDIADLRDVIDRLASELAKERESSPLRRVQELSAQLAAERAAVREVVAEMRDMATKRCLLPWGHATAWADKLEAIGGGK